MAVSCSGRTRVLEQVGEKQDFEIELSRRGFRHEDFTLHVLSHDDSGLPDPWNPRYRVRVIHRPTQTAKTYDAGPRERWVACFATDLVEGRYGRPTVSQPLPTQPQSGRHRNRRS